MKASELESQLRAMREAHGDFDVAINTKGDLGVESVEKVGEVETMYRDERFPKIYEQGLDHTYFLITE